MKTNERASMGVWVAFCGIVRVCHPSHPSPFNFESCVRVAKIYCNFLVNFCIFHPQFSPHTVETRPHFCIPSHEHNSKSAKTNTDKRLCVKCEFSSCGKELGGWMHFCDSLTHALKIILCNIALIIINFAYHTFHMMKILRESVGAVFGHEMLLMLLFGIGWWGC